MIFRIYCIHVLLHIVLLKFLILRCQNTYFVDCNIPSKNMKINLQNKICVFHVALTMLKTHRRIYKTNKVKDEIKRKCFSCQEILDFALLYINFLLIFSFFRLPKIINLFSITKETLVVEKRICCSKLDTVYVIKRPEIILLNLKIVLKKIKKRKVLLACTINVKVFPH